MPETILFVPSVKKGNGTGHLKRVIKICQEIRNHSENKTGIFLDCDAREISRWKDEIPELNKQNVIGPHNPDIGKYDLIILDQRKSSREEFHRWESLGKVVLLDEGGASRYYGSLLIDTLPGIHEHEPNYSDLSFLALPRRHKTINWSDPSVLISFGGEDPEKLTLPVLNKLLDQVNIRADRIGVVQGPLMDNITVPPGVRLYRNVSDLTPLFETHDIFVGAFGLTPLEAASAGCAVLLVNPSPYHEKLSGRAGLISSGVRKRGIKKLPALFSRIIVEKKEPSPWEDKPDISLGRFLNGLKEGGKSSCPLCLAEKNPVVDRFQSRTYYYCRSCYNYYMVNWQDEEENYDREYFFSRYKNQYGKTYLEDFSYIRELGYERLKEIEKYYKTDLKREELLLTDLGCAFGPFLSAAGERGFACRGVEINKEGAEWVQKHLGYPVINGSLTDEGVREKLKKEKSHMVTLWYVIEHLAGQHSLLEDLYDFLYPGGLLAFSTPSGKGISARRNRRVFLKNSPADHYVVYTPQGARRILAKAGFSVKKIKSVGHHPERFGKWVGKKGSITYNMVMFFSRIFFLGDSLEVYALKVDKKEQSK